MGLLFVALAASAVLPGLIFTLSIFGAVLGIPALLLTAFWAQAGGRLLMAGQGPNRTSRWLGGLASFFLLVLWNATLGELALTGTPRHGPFAIERWAQAKLFLWLEGPAALTVLWYLARGPAALGHSPRPLAGPTPRPGEARSAAARGGPAERPG